MEVRPLMVWWPARVRDLGSHLRRASYTGTPGVPVWDGIVADVTGALMDLGIQMVALFLLGAGVVPVLRGQFAGVHLLFLAAGLALLALLISRVLRSTYIVTVRRFGSVDLRVNTVSVPYFVVDLSWLAFGVAWLYGALKPVAGSGLAPDPAFDLGSPAIILSTVVVLFWLRWRTRLRGR